MIRREEPDKRLSTTHCGRPESRILPRRCFIRSGMLAAAAVVLRGSPILDSLTAGAQTSGADLIHDTLNGLIGFVVPGPDSSTPAEQVIALRTLIDRLDSGEWRLVDPEALNHVASQLRPMLNPIPPLFFDFAPDPFVRPLMLSEE